MTSPFRSILAFFSVPLLAAPVVLAAAQPLPPVFDFRYALGPATCTSGRMVSHRPDWWQDLRVVGRDSDWNLRISVVYEPVDAPVTIWGWSTDPRSGSSDRQGSWVHADEGSGGYAEYFVRVSRRTPSVFGVAVGNASCADTITYRLQGEWTDSRDHAVPALSDGFPYNDLEYVDLVHGGDVSNESRQLWTTNPDFYIRLAGPEDIGDCRTGRRVSFDLLNFWRSLVPVLAEQLTGVPYRGLISAGCRDRPDEDGVITVHYTTPDEYIGDWGDAAGRARVGAWKGRIWIRSATGGVSPEVLVPEYDGHLIAHEVGHAFGLLHPGPVLEARDPDIVMISGGNWSRMFFTALEEAASRRMYERNRDRGYCGDPRGVACRAAPSSLRLDRSDAGRREPPLLVLP